MPPAIATTPRDAQGLRGVRQTQNIARTAMAAVTSSSVTPVPIVDETPSAGPLAPQWVGSFGPSRDDHASHVAPMTSVGAHSRTVTRSLRAVVMSAPS